MIVLHSSLSEKDLDKKLKEVSECSLITASAWLDTHNLDGSRKFGNTKIKNTKNLVITESLDRETLC